MSVPVPSSTHGNNECSATENADQGYLALQYIDPALLILPPAEEAGLSILDPIPATLEFTPGIASQSHTTEDATTDDCTSMSEEQDPLNTAAPTAGSSARPQKLSKNSNTKSDPTAPLPSIEELIKTSDDPCEQRFAALTVCQNQGTTPYFYLPSLQTYNGPGVSDAAVLSSEEYTRLWERMRRRLRRGLGSRRGFIRSNGTKKFRKALIDTPVDQSQMSIVKDWWHDKRPHRSGSHRRKYVMLALSDGTTFDLSAAIKNAADPEGAGTTTHGLREQLEMLHRIRLPKDIYHQAHSRVISWRRSDMIWANRVGGSSAISTGSDTCESVWRGGSRSGA